MTKLRTDLLIHEPANTAIYSSADKLPSPVMSSSQQFVGSYGRNMLSVYQLELTFNVSCNYYYCECFEADEN